MKQKNTVELPVRKPRAEIFATAEESFRLKFELLAEAKHSILISTFIIKADDWYAPDDIGKALADILIEKTRQGLEVKVFTDYWGNAPTTRKETNRMISGGVDVRYFAYHQNILDLMKISWKGLVSINIEKLNHGKTLVIDGWHSFTGGYNWMRGKSKKIDSWRDTDMFLQGPISERVSKDFYNLFNRLQKLTPGESTPETRYLYPNCPSEYEDEFYTQAPWLDGGSTPINDRILDLLRQAEPGDHIYWQSFSFRPQNRFLDEIRAAASRGVKVKILTNSRRCMKDQLAFIILPPARKLILDKLHGEAVKYYETIANLSKENPVELLEYNSPNGPMHAKTFLLLKSETLTKLGKRYGGIDFAGVAGAGTYNVSPNSWNQHIETMFFTSRPNIVKDLYKLYLRDISMCKLLNQRVLLRQ